jgi:biopolymer transport protein ExbB
MAELLDILSKGGFVAPPLVLGALLMWWAIGWRFLTLRDRGHASAKEAIAAAKEGKAKGILGFVAVRALATTGYRDPRPHLEAVVAPMRASLDRHAALVRTVVILAPLAGLLGTVTGMIETFESLADMALFSRSGGIAGGISEALFSTQMGLVVSVPGLIAGRLLEGRQHRLEDELDELVDRVAAREVA